MRNLKIIAIVLLSFCFMTKVYSQSSVSFHVGPSIPISDFGSDDVNDDDNKGASVGLNAGLQYVYTLSESGLGIFAGVDFNYNALKKGYKDDIEELFKSVGIHDIDIDFYKYINVPITAGLNFTYQGNGMVGVFANAGAAFNLLKMTDMKAKSGGQTVKTEMELANSFGFKVGGGILIDKNYSISVDYLGLGNHDIKGKAKAVGYSEDIDEECKVDLLTVTFGIRF